MTWSPATNNNQSWKYVRWSWALRKILKYESLCFFYFSQRDDKWPVLQTLGVPSEFLKEQSHDEWINVAVQENSSSGRKKKKKKDMPMTIGGQQWPGEWVFGVHPPRGASSDIARITIRGKIKWPLLPLSLNYTCKLPLHRPAAAPQKKPACSFVLATGRCFDCLLAVSPDNHRAQKQIPLA